MFGSGQLALPDDRKWLGGPPGCPGGPLGFLGVVGKPSRMSGSVQKALPNVWEALPDVWEASQIPGSVRDTLPNVQVWSENPHGCPGVFERPSRPSRMSGSGRWPFRMYGSEQEALPDDREWLGIYPRCSGGLTGYPLVDWPSRLSGSGREALPDFREWSGGPPGCLAVVGRPTRICGRPSRMSGSGRETLPNVREVFLDVREWSVGPPGCPGVVGSLSRMSGSGQESLPNVQ